MLLQQLRQPALPFGAVGDYVHEDVKHGRLRVKGVIAAQLFLIRLHDRRLDTELPVPETGMVGAEVPQVRESMKP